MLKMYFQVFQKIMIRYMSQKDYLLKEGIGPKSSLSLSFFFINDNNLHSITFNKTDKQRPETQELSVV